MVFVQAACRFGEEGIGHGDGRLRGLIQSDVVLVGSLVFLVSVEW